MQHKGVFTFSFSPSSIFFLFFIFTQLNKISRKNTEKLHMLQAFMDSTSSLYTYERQVQLKIIKQNPVSVK